jgi:hypothetical protein
MLVKALVVNADVVWVSDVALRRWRSTGGMGGGASTIALNESSDGPPTGELNASSGGPPTRAVDEGCVSITAFFLLLISRGSFKLIQRKSGPSSISFVDFGMNVLTDRHKTFFRIYFKSVRKYEI